MFKEIESVVFDFGGVIIDLYPQRTFDKLRQSLGIDAEAEFKQLALDIELGEISAEKFLESVNDLCGNRVSLTELEQTWNAMLGEIDPAKVLFLEQLKKHYKVYLLSNTNIVHKNYFDITCNKSFGMSMEDFFHKTIYSHEISMRKPDRGIFEYLIQTLNLSPNKILFIDDLEENILMAKELGIQTKQFERNGNFDCLRNLII
ncbi:HAD family phosphatase [Halobacteriovorax sp. HLS]|uniref:HAD family hydrolase n=1 Tax=Halobacteriovorax sp. HLS TaxID=2234000 RepID=UPI000FDCCCE1|nr:HAD family phosphatase [Halobacteriovorax sp. HLS]